MGSLKQVYRRLHNHWKSTRLQSQLSALDREIALLRQVMAQDDQAAATNRIQYLKSPTLVARRLDDRKYLTDLLLRRLQLVEQIGALQ